MRYTIITSTHNKRRGMYASKHVYDNVDKIMRDVNIDIFKDYCERNKERLTGYTIVVLAYNVKGTLVKTTTTHRVYSKYKATLRYSNGETVPTVYGNSLENLIRMVQHTINKFCAASKDAWAEASITETQIMREKTGVGIDVIVNNISGITRH